MDSISTPILESHKLPEAIYLVIIGSLPEGNRLNDENGFCLFRHFCHKSSLQRLMDKSNSLKGWELSIHARAVYDATSGALFYADKSYPSFYAMYKDKIEAFLTP